MRIIVTGGAGFIGSNLVDFLLKNNHEVIVIDDLSSGKMINLEKSLNRITLIHSQLEKVDLNQFKEIDSVVHLAAQVSVPLSISNFKSSSETNIISTLNILNFCNEKKIPLVYASSSAVYGNLNIGDDQNSKVDLLSPYAADKYLIEIYSAVLFKLNKLSSIGLRFFNVYGPRQDPTSPYSGVISVFIDRIIKNKIINIYGGSQTRDFVHVNDVILAISRSIEMTKQKAVNETVNILTGKTTSIDDLAAIVYQKLNQTDKKKYSPMQKGDPMKSDGSTKKMKNFLGIKPSSMILIKDGLSETIDFLRDSKN